MSRECARQRAREEACVLEATLGPGAVVELVGVRLLVLFAEPRASRGAAAGHAPGAPAANAATRVPPVA